MKTSISKPPRYFTQRPKPNCFHAVEFGVKYTPRGATDGVLGELYDIPIAHAESRRATASKQLRHEMQIFHDGSIVDTFGNLPGKPTVKRSRGVQFKE